VSTRPWALVLSELRSRTSSDWTKDAVEIREIVGTEPFSGTGNELYQPAASFARFICHFLIERMPDRALPELCQTMAEYFDFYIHAPNTRLALASHHNVHGVVREVRVVPPFRIPDE